MAFHSWLASLSGCDSVPSLIAEEQGCSNETGQQAAISIIKDAALKKLDEHRDDYDNSLILGSTVRAALNQTQFLFDNIRTIQI
ncbi:MAG: hypothetical protein E2598_10390 [Sphingobium sp.]|nr:hypothetical protein [Sphingobium sp.]